MPTAARTTKSRTKNCSLEPIILPRKRRPEALTTREQKILELIWTGFKNKIAQRLKISVKTVEAHRANMMKKIRVSNTAQLLKAAIQGKNVEAPVIRRLTPSTGAFTTLSQRFIQDDGRRSQTFRTDFPQHGDMCHVVANRSNTGAHPSPLRQRRVPLALEDPAVYTI